MGRIARVVVPGLPHHVTQRGNNRQAVFVDDDDRRLYVSLLRERATDARLRILAYCLMPNHVHLIVVPEAHDSLAKAMGRTHLHFTQWFNHRHAASGHLWQNRFYSCPLDEAHGDRAFLYVEHNPVRAKLVRYPWDYAWSSAEAHLTHVDQNGLLDLDWWQERWDPVTWRELLLGALGDEDLGRIRRCTAGGRPFGSAEFVERLEATLGRSLHAAPVGRPRR